MVNGRMEIDWRRFDRKAFIVKALLPFPFYPEISC